MKRRPLSLAVLIAVLLIGAFGWSMRLVQADGCTNPYIVQPGDTLSAIAKRIGTTVRELVRLNYLPHPDYIRSGQLLCLPVEKIVTTLPPTETPSTPTLTVTVSAPATPTLPQNPDTPGSMPLLTFDLVVEYEFSPTVAGRDAPYTQTIGLFTQDRKAGIRQHFPIHDSDVITFADALDLRDDSIDKLPRLWLARDTNTPPFTYTLVVIDDPAPLLGLVITPTMPITTVIPNAFSVEQGNDPNFFCFPQSREAVRRLLEVASPPGMTLTNIELRAELVSLTGIYLPIQIDAIDYLPTAQVASLCYNFVGFAINTEPISVTEGYQMALVLSPQGTGGIPGDQYAQRCGYWSSGGWWGRFWYGWYGCAR